MLEFNDAPTTDLLSMRKKSCMSSDDNSTSQGGRVFIQLLMLEHPLSRSAGHSLIVSSSLSVDEADLRSEAKLSPSWAPNYRDKTAASKSVIDGAKNELSSILDISDSTSPFLRNWETTRV
jgi:hypothetical protein